MIRKLVSDFSRNVTSCQKSNTKKNTLDNHRIPGCYKRASDPCQVLMGSATFGFGLTVILTGRFAWAWPIPSRIRRVAYSCVFDSLHEFIYFGAH